MKQFNQHLRILFLMVTEDFYFHCFSFCQSKVRIGQEDIQISRRTSKSLLEDSVSCVFTLIRNFCLMFDLLGNRFGEFGVAILF